MIKPRILLEPDGVYKRKLKIENNPLFNLILLQISAVGNVHKSENGKQMIAFYILVNVYEM
jgi:hypothetical protein